jgi:hypothetical protein
VAFVHGALVVFMLIGSLLALRWPRLVWYHAPVGLAILGINLAGYECPITDVELWFRDAGGAPPYTGGFLGHYAYQPLGLDAHSSTVQLGIYMVALVPNVIGYTLLTRKSIRRRRALRAAPAAVPTPRAPASPPSPPPPHAQPTPAPRLPPVAPAAWERGR